jgi:hypothetical protein
MVNIKSFLNRTNVKALLFMVLIKQQKLYKFSHQGTKAQRRDINLTLYKKGIYARYRAYERNANTLSFKIFRQTF